MDLPVFQACVGRRIVAVTPGVGHDSELVAACVTLEFEDGSGLAVASNGRCWLVSRDLPSSTAESWGEWVYALAQCDPQGEV